MSEARTDTEAVEQANTAFYDAVERGDFEEVADLWLDDRHGDVSCVHPGWPVFPAAEGRTKTRKRFTM